MVKIRKRSSYRVSHRGFYALLFSALSLVLLFMGILGLQQRITDQTSAASNMSARCQSGPNVLLSWTLPKVTAVKIIQRFGGITLTELAKGNSIVFPVKGGSTYDWVAYYDSGIHLKTGPSFVCGSCCISEACRRDGSYVSCPASTVCGSNGKCELKGSGVGGGGVGVGSADNGRCQRDNIGLKCTGGYLSGLCPGDSHFRYCQGGYDKNANPGSLYGSSGVGGANPSGGSCKVTSPCSSTYTKYTLGVGSANSASVPYVSALQTQLTNKGYGSSYLGTTGACKNGIDGSFGSKTKSAVIAYQKAHGLTADGIVGPKTWGSLCN